MHMIRVLKQNEMIPNVVRCVGSPTHEHEGLVGVGVGALAVGLSICFIDPSCWKRAGGFARPLDSGQPFICEDLVYITLDSQYDQVP